MENNKQHRKPGTGNGSSNGQNQTTGNGGEAQNGRLATIKNHSTEGGETLNEYISGHDKYEG
ncbi:hypothetical protein ACTNDP_04735 [Paenibacillus barengoltzii]|jgi:hypothetical protein|uniref:hypothetical protein n=1 Tax=Paenibacillus TaxID=44249 RepID=UPI0028FD276B|nr:MULTISPECIES: hypothetical protein [Paenibacillus]MDU0331336.1 hypothetical protein [Paenibacillus sp. 3LSP]MEC2343836.1 hypothetical protein [Paenibacillus barengoltzii]